MESLDARRDEDFRELSGTVLVMPFSHGVDGRQHGPKMGSYLDKTLTRDSRATVESLRIRVHWINWAYVLPIMPKGRDHFTLA